jgi:hypothetical protein
VTLSAQLRPDPRSFVVDGGFRLFIDENVATEAVAGPAPVRKEVELLGAIVNDGVLGRLDAASARATGAGRVAVASRAIGHPGFPEARVRTPLVVHASEGSPEIAGECFGPVSYLVSTPSAVSTSPNLAAISANGAHAVSFGTRLLIVRQ